MKIKLVLISIMLMITSFCLSCRQDGELSSVNINKQQHRVLNRHQIVDSLYVAFEDGVHESVQEPSLVIHTHRDYHDFLSGLINKIGPNYGRYCLAQPDSIVGAGLWEWNGIDFFGYEGIDLRLDMDVDGDPNTITIWVWDQHKNRISDEPQVISFFEDLADSLLLTSQIVSSGGGPPASYLEFEEVFELSSVEISKFLDRYLGVNADCIEFYCLIDSLGNLNDLNITYGEVYERAIRIILENIDYPILIYNGSDTAFYHMSLRTWISDEKYLNIIVPQVENKLSRNINSYADTTNQVIHAGALFTRGETICYFRIPNSDRIYFYSFCKGRLTPMAHFETKIEGDWILPDQYIDLDHDGVKEFILESFHNMNGNTWKTIFHYDTISKKISIAGNIWGDWQIINKQGDILNIITGSWYMPNYFNIYGWNNGKLLMKKSVCLELQQGNYREEDQIITYYENPYFDQGLDTTVLIFRDEFSKKHESLWASFEKLAGW